MKTNFLFVFVFFAVPVLGQNADSLAVAREVDSLIQVSDNFTIQGAFEEALEVNTVAEKIALERFGPESAVYGGCCYNRGTVLASQGDNLQAIKWYLEAKTIFGKALGKEHLHYAFCLNNLGNIYQEMGDYEKAESLYLDSKAILEKAPGKEHPYYGNSLIGLANLYLELGNYEKAKLLLLEAKSILEKALGKEHPYYAIILNNLANMYMGMGDYEKAEPLYFESKSIREKTLGKEHSDYAASLTNLAHMYSDLGNYEKAEPFYLDSKTIREKSLGKDHPDYAYSLSNLAMLYTDMGNYEKALPLHLETLTIQEKNLGKDHPDYAGSLINLAILYYNLGNYEKAETLYLEAKEIFESRIKNLEHPYYMNCMINLAMLYRKTSNYEIAERFNLKVKATWEKTLGKDHPDYAGSLNNLGHLYVSMGDYEKAEPLIDELTHLNQSLITKAMHHLSERELNAYLNKFSESQYLALSYAQLAGGDKSAPNCFNYALFYKGFLLNAAGQIKRLALSDSQTTEKYNLLKSCERRLAAQYAQPITERDSTAVVALEAKANDLEKDLARTVAGFGQALRQVNWQEIQAALKPDEAAVELVNYRYYQKKQTDSTMYAALVLLPGAAQPRFVSLFEEKQLDSLLLSQGERKADYVNALYTIAERGTKPLGKPKKSLYELLWKPLEKHLAGVNTIYYSPAGLLHRINIAAIPINLDSVLGDRYHLVELGSTRQLVIPTEIKPAGNDALLFGGIQYDSDSTAIAQANAALDSISIVSRGELSFTYTDSSLRVGTWSELPFTDREITGIGRIMQTAGIKTETRRGYSATEESFKSIGAGKKPSPRILHIATHGFFFPDPKSATSSERVSGEREPVFKISDHPMIRSGLILAGGNHAWSRDLGSKPLKPGMEDGILTAYEISQMNLSNTELVVLSACETGLGDIQGNEGVYGLQRAFKIAGAKYLIMSLWQVPDKQTSLLMTTFYKKWLEEKMAIPEAFRAAQKELREAGLDPYYWAGFVLVE